MGLWSYLLTFKTKTAQSVVQFFSFLLVTLCNIRYILAKLLVIAYTVWPDIGACCLF